MSVTPPRPEPPGPLTRSVRITGLVVGSLLVATGSVAVFVTDNSFGSAALVSAGVVFLVLALLGNYMEAFEAGGVKFSFYREAVARLEEAARAEAAGDPDHALQLRLQADQLLAAAEGVANRYDLLRSREPSGWERTSRMESLLRELRGLDVDTATADTVTELFDSGWDGRRIAALALVQARPRLGNARVLRLAISEPRSAFEQYQALSAAQLAWAHLGDGDRQALVTVLDQGLASADFGPAGSDRRRLAGQILKLAE
jgi:hypothetical protein